MTPSSFLRHYEFDRRTARGGYFPSAPLTVEEGDRVGVVLLNQGGPESLSDVQPFLYNRLMDPVRYEVPVGGRTRRWGSKALASLWASSMRERYELIGGGSPLTRLSREQAESLEGHLNDMYGDPTRVDFCTYLAMRYWAPFSEQAAAQMAEDGIDKVVLLPLYPQYSKTTSGSALAYWHALDATGEIPSWPTTAVLEYAANPRYVRAVSERIDEGLQRFPRSVRDDVQLLFSAHSTPRRERTRRADPYCCLVHTTVDQVMTYRGSDRAAHTAFLNREGPLRWLEPNTRSVLEACAGNGEGPPVLVVPLPFVTDHLETSYELDIEMRAEAERLGIQHYEVTAGLNTHPLFIEALGEAAVAQLDLPLDPNQLRYGGDGVSADYPLRPYHERPRLNSSGHRRRCPNCECTAEARRWTVGEGGDEEEPTATDPPEIPAPATPEPSSS